MIAPRKMWTPEELGFTQPSTPYSVYLCAGVRDIRTIERREYPQLSFHNGTEESDTV